jgi:alkyldihydroxyacetonephosphate synthase
VTATASVGRALGAIVGERFVERGAALAALSAAARAGDGEAWLVKPGSAAEVAEIVRTAAGAGVAVIPVGNAARAPRARLGERPRLFVDLRRMNHVLHLDETSLLVHAQAGLSGLGLERLLGPRGLSLGDYPPAALGSTIGGLLAVRTPGKSSPRHGFLEDAVLGVSAVLADGRSVHTRVAPRRATGPDLARAFLGSEGTLGVITSAVLRIHRRPEARFLAAWALPGVGHAVAAMHLAMRVYDHAEALVHVGPVCEPGEAVLAVATAGPTDLAACDRDLVDSATAALGGRRLDEEVARSWWRRRTGQVTEPPLPLPSLQVCASPSREAAVYDAVLSAAAAGDAAGRAHFARFDADGAVLFFTFTATDGSVLGDEALDDLVDAAAAAAQHAGAFLLGASNPALEPYFQDLRRALDPGNILNPGALR